MSAPPVSFLTSLRLLLGVVLRTTPWRSALLLVLAASSGLLAPAVMAATGLAVARASAALAADLAPAAVDDLLAALGLVGVLFLAERVLTPVRTAVGYSIGSTVVQALRERLFAATLTPPGIGHLEDPETANDIERGRELEWDVGPMTRVVAELATVVTTAVAALGAAVLLVRLAWWVPVVLLGSVVLSHLWMRRDDRREVEQREDYAVLQRRAEYFCDLALAPPAAKEIRLFGLVDQVAAETRRHRVAFLSQLWRVRRAQWGPVTRTVATILLANAVAFGGLVAGVLDGTVTTGDLAVYVQAVGAVVVFGHGHLDLWWVYQGAAALPHLLALEARAADGTSRGGLSPVASRPAAGAGAGAVVRTSAAGRPRRELRLSGVRFGYPGAAQPVLDGLDLVVPAGTSLAIVGANGAGKTTLLKLLTRLYDPDDGAILVDGVDLRTLDPAAWRRQVAVVFQDFVRYELSARDNVGFGGTPDGGTPDGDLAGLRRAARRAGVLSLVEDLPNGWETVLARQYRGGVDLSGGQWQRIALARALRAADCGARLLVLDEPTAHLDVRAEAALFDRFLDLTAGMTTLLVTHRLSSVRHADRICVLGRGRVVEDGTHEELLAAGGAYARMFRLQADRFESGVTHG